MKPLFLNEQGTLEGSLRLEVEYFNNNINLLGLLLSGVPAVLKQILLLLLLSSVK